MDIPCWIELHEIVNISVLVIKNDFIHMHPKANTHMPPIIPNTSVHPEARRCGQAMTMPRITLPVCPGSDRKTEVTSCVSSMKVFSTDMKNPWELERQLSRSEHLLLCGGPGFRSQLLSSL